MISAYQRLTYTVVYGGERLPGFLRAVELFASWIPYRLLRRMADRADRREAAARYDDGSRRVGILRRRAIDRYDHRSDATCIYYAELRARNVGTCEACGSDCHYDEADTYDLPTVGLVRLCLECGPGENRANLR